MYIEVIKRVAEHFDIVPSLLISICTVETNLTNVVRYSDGIHNSYGICQVQLPTAREVAGKHLDSLALLQPEVNAKVAAMYLKKHITNYGNDYEAIAAYNAGRARYNNAGVIRNKKYVDKVFRVWYDLTQ